MTERSWNQYVHRNTTCTDKHYADCQLVTTVNAYYHLKGFAIAQNSDQYRDLAELCGCCFGGCIDISKAWERLGIWEDQRFDWFDGVNHLDEHGGFFEVSIWHARYGFHSAAIVDYIPKAEAARMTGFRYETTVDGWIFLEKLKPHVVDYPRHEETSFVMRTFKITD